MIRSGGAALLLGGLLLSCAGPERSPAAPVRLTRAAYEDRLHAAWAGQVIGMLLAYPFEHEMGAAVRVETILKRYEGTPARFESAPVDDDWYYEMVALNGFEKYGPGMTADQLGRQWVENAAGTWGSSRGAREALLRGVPGSEAGHPRHNPEWWTIGAQFSADLYGLVAPGRPNLAARLARSLGHVNGYAEGADGAVFVAGMVSLAFVETDPRAVVRKAAALIHPDSPYRRCLEEVLSRAEAGRPWKEIAGEIGDRWHARYPATNNAVANGGILALGVWFGAGDFLETVNVIAQAADFTDADCNAASAAAVVGAMRGLGAIPPALVAAIGDRMKGEKLGDLVLTPPVDLTFKDLAVRTAKVGERFLAAEGLRVTEDALHLEPEAPRALSLERFELADLTRFWNPDWTLERAGFGPMRHFRRGTYLSGDVLVTWPANEARGVVLRRTLRLGDRPRLAVQAGVLPGRAWMLEIYADNVRLIARRIDAPPAPGRGREPVWHSVEADLAPFAGRSVHLRLLQNLLLTEGAPGTAFWRAVQVE